MLDTHEKFRMVDKSGKNDFFFEVNWNPKDVKSNDCQVFRVLFPDGGGKEAYIDRKHLIEMLFACGSPEEQQNMIPQTLTTVHYHRTMLGVKVKKDIQKGEMMNFPIEIPCEFHSKREQVLGKPKVAKKGLLS